MARASLFERLKDMSEKAWKRADRRYKPYEKISDKIDYYLEREGTSDLTPQQSLYYRNIINNMKPEYKKLGDAYEEASNLAEILENLKVNEQIYRP